ncbi:hypothetical protein SKAU_G00322690 [Synaphobranchus kaupii]|uniref:Uncharacterized protein n=1 Tax=Synaphobranchus kaupii TaxID=118154 RepID=A0A9Q1ENY9_SYNKA|nr:hypothetical protein SKAU_G00322690 [Synaphobranchus kaupii]
MQPFRLTRFLLAGSLALTGAQPPGQPRSNVIPGTWTTYQATSSKSAKEKPTFSSTPVPVLIVGVPGGHYGSVPEDAAEPSWEERGRRRAAELVPREPRSAVHLFQEHGLDPQGLGDFTQTDRQTLPGPESDKPLGI